jgi:glycosyltransferase involved in cell wall biosynthesis
MQPKVSVCCVTYNQVSYIKASLDSFLMQETNFDFEIIIHDDASTDGTSAIIREYQEKYPDIIKAQIQIENQWSKGVRGIFARFTFPRCQGKYIALCEGDDYWTDPLKLQKQVDFLENNEEVNICFHRANLLRNGNFMLHEIPSDFEGKLFSYVELLRTYNFITTASVLFRKPEVFHFPDWYYKLPFGDLGIYKLVSSNKKIYCMPDVMSVYRIHDEGMWSGLSEVKAQEKYLSFYKNISPALNVEEKKVVRQKVKEAHSKIAKLKFPGNRFLKKMYCSYLSLKY